MLSREKFQRVHVLVVGDVMLDRYWFGEVERISPEAPVPVVSVVHNEHRAGGAANVATNIAALGARCTLLSVIGDDDDGRLLSQMLTQPGITPILMVDERANTTVKLRILSRNQQLLRADFEKAPANESLMECLGHFRNKLSETDVVLISDYGKGGLSHIGEMIGAAVDQGKTVIVDPKGSDFSRYRNASMITPNLKELEWVIGSWSNDDELEDQVRRLISELEIDSLLLTKSEQGMSLYFANGDSIHREAVAKDVYDVSGAGDTVIGACAVAMGAGLSGAEMLSLSNAAAGIVVEKLGTATASFEEVVEHLEVNG